MSYSNKAVEQLIEAISMMDHQEAVEFLSDFLEDFSLTKDVSSSTISTLDKYGY